MRRFALLAALVLLIVGAIFGSQALLLWTGFLAPPPPAPSSTVSPELQMTLGSLGRQIADVSQAVKAQPLRSAAENAAILQKLDDLAKGQVDLQAELERLRSAIPSAAPAAKPAPGRQSPAAPLVASLPLPSQSVPPPAPIKPAPSAEHAAGADASPVPAAAAAPSGGATRQVVVGPNDTLFAISRRTGVAVQAIADANGLRPPYIVAKGQTLALPGSASALPEPPLQQGPAPAAAPASGSVADIVALPVTPTGDGIIEVPNGGAGAFAIASVNNGATAQITASVDTGAAKLPLTVTICESNPASGQCLAPPASTVSLNFLVHGTPSFSIFLQASHAIPLAPGTSRVYVRFKDASGAVRGSASVAVATRD